MREMYPSHEQEPIPRHLYIAGKLQRSEKVDEFYDYFESLGHTITLKWTELEEFPKPYVEHAELWSPQAEKMISAATEADTFILLNHGELKGALIELGAFLASPNKRDAFIINPGNRQSVFFTHPCVTTFEDEQALRAFFEREV